MIARASDVVAMSFRAFAIRNFIIAPLVFADLILLSVRIDRLIHIVKTASTNKIRRPLSIEVVERKTQPAGLNTIPGADRIPARGSCTSTTQGHRD